MGEAEATQEHKKPFTPQLSKAGDKKQLSKISADPEKLKWQVLKSGVNIIGALMQSKINWVPESS